MEWSEEKKIKLERVTRSRKKKNTDWYEANGVSSSAREREREERSTEQSWSFREARVSIGKFRSCRERESGFGWWSDSEEKRREEKNQIEFRGILKGNQEYLKKLSKSQDYDDYQSIPNSLQNPCTYTTPSFPKYPPIYG